MRIISHRGNIGSGQNRSENTIESINDALSLGFDVEVDIWRKDNSIWLGHDFPQHYLFEHWQSHGQNFLDDKRIWFHTKNLEALHYMKLYHPTSNFFWHQNDDYTLTSSGKIWTFPEKSLCGESIIVALDHDQIDYAMQYPIYGICTDDPIYVRDNLKEKPGIENRYKEYVEGCMIENIPPMSFSDFHVQIQDGKCEICLVFDEPACSCKS
jgi:hypothetical protein